MENGGISKEAVEYLKEIFVEKDDCNDRHAVTAKEISEIAIAMTKISTQLSMITKLVTSLVLSTGGAIMAAILRLIIK